MISVSYDDWEYPLDTRVRDGVSIVSLAATSMLREKGELPEAQSSCYSTASDRSPGKLPPSALRRCVCACVPNAFYIFFKTLIKGVNRTLWVFLIIYNPTDRGVSGHGYLWVHFYLDNWSILEIKAEFTSFVLSFFPAGWFCDWHV